MLYRMWSQRHSHPRVTSSSPPPNLPCSIPYRECVVKGLSVTVRHTKRANASFLFSYKYGNFVLAACRTRRMVVSLLGVVRFFALLVLLNKNIFNSKAFLVFGFNSSTVAFAARVFASAPTAHR